MSEPISIDVVLPCYNEISVLRSSVERTLQFFDTAPQYKWHIVIADNGSTDRTDELARTLAVENEQISVIAIPKKVAAMHYIKLGQQVQLTLSHTWTSI